MTWPVSATLWGIAGCVLVVVFIVIYERRRKVKRFLVAITAVNVVDIASTLWLVDRIGWGYEGNFFVRWCFQRFGVWPASTIKIGGVLVLAAGLWLTCREASKVWGTIMCWLPWLLFLGFTFITAFNVGGVIALWGI